MNLENIKAGMVIKNYKELCLLLDEKVKGGESKKAQLREFERFVKYHKDGNKIIVDEVYITPLPKNDKRKDGNNKKYKNLTIHIPKLYGYITDTFGHDVTTLSARSNIELEWLCPKCNEKHIKSIDNVYTVQHTLCPECLLSKGARKINDLLKDVSVDFKREVKFDDLKSKKGICLRFDFGLYKNDELIGLIEYDGEYHDIHNLTQVYDEIKNEYCKVNHIPLLRIHHTEQDVLPIKLHNFLKELGYVNLHVIIDVIVSKYEKQISHYQNKINKLQEEMNEILSIFN